VILRYRIGDEGISLNAKDFRALVEIMRPYVEAEIEKKKG